MCVDRSFTLVEIYQIPVIVVYKKAYSLYASVKLSRKCSYLGMAIIWKEPTINMLKGCFLGEGDVIRLFPICQICFQNEGLCIPPVKLSSTPSVILNFSK